MEQLLLQVKVLLITVLGGIAFIPGPKRDGELRITGPLNNVISYLGILFMLGPWIAITFLDQPRFEGLVRIVLDILGMLFIITSVILYTFSLKYLLTAFKEQFSEFTPESLIREGPYRYVRHPIYLASLMIVSGLYFVYGATLSILFLPLFYFTFRLVTIYEEKQILEPRFLDEYRAYRGEVAPAILGFWGGLAFTVLYLLLSVLSLMDFFALFNFKFIT